MELRLPKISFKGKGSKPSGTQTEGRKPAGEAVDSSHRRDNAQANGAEAARNAQAADVVAAIDNTRGSTAALQELAREGGQKQLTQEQLADIIKKAQEEAGGKKLTQADFARILKGERADATAQKGDEEIVNEELEAELREARGGESAQEVRLVNQRLVTETPQSITADPVFQDIEQKLLATRTATGELTPVDKQEVRGDAIAQFYNRWAEEHVRTGQLPVGEERLEFNMIKSEVEQEAQTRGETVSAEDLLKRALMAYREKRDLEFLDAEEKKDKTKFQKMIPYLNFLGIFALLNIPGIVSSITSDDSRSYH